MGTSLTGLTPSTTYDALIKVGDNGAIDGTLKRLSDGLGNDLPLLVSSTALTNYGAGGIATNTAFGDAALDSNTSGANNVALGKNSLTANTSGSYNTSVGVDAALSNTSGEFITAIGYQALRANTTGAYNTAVGYSALLSNTSGNYNSAINYESLKDNTTGSYNAATGLQSLQSNRTGSFNTAMGVQSLQLQTTGSNNSVLGWNHQSGNFSGVTMIGVSDTATGNNQMRFGSTSVVNGAVANEVNASSKVWNVFINGVAYKILLA